MIQELLKKEEGKTLEFKENASSLYGIVKTVVAFANTAGGTLVIGVEDKTKKIVGLSDPLEDEMRIMNKMADSIVPQCFPSIEIQTHQKQPIIIIQVSYQPAPFYVKKEREQIAYVRLGSTNRIADTETLATLTSLSRNIVYDEEPCVKAMHDDLDWQAMKDIFNREDKTITNHKAQSLGILTKHFGKEYPSNGGILLFGSNRAMLFPDAKVRCVCFRGITRGDTRDHRDITTHLPLALDETLHFIEKNTFTATTIVGTRRVNKPDYPTIAIREAVTNALIHTDYSIKGSSILVALFDNRLEITNPGGLPPGLSLQDALLGSSRARNRVIIRTFHHLNIVEQWGSGFQKIIEACEKQGLQQPMFEELGSQFRVTLFSTPALKPKRSIRISRA